MVDVPIFGVRPFVCVTTDERTRTVRQIFNVLNCREAAERSVS